MPLLYSVIEQDQQGTHYSMFSSCTVQNSALQALCWQRLSVGYGSNDNRIRIGERVELEQMVCPSDCKYLHQRLLLAIINFLSLNVEDISTIIFTKKNVDVPFQQFYQQLKLCLQPMYCITSVVQHNLALQHQCCIAT